jgi:hypothetical protein
MRAIKFQSVLTKIAKYGLAVHAILYFAWAALLSGADLTHGAEHLVFYGVWVVASGLLLIFSIMNSRIFSERRAIWVYGAASIVFVSQALFWIYFFFYFQATDPVDETPWTVFFAFNIFGLPTMSCGWLAVSMAWATFSSVRNL